MEGRRSEGGESLERSCTNWRVAPQSSLIMARCEREEEGE